jgi:hypothetical protein
MSGLTDLPKHVVDLIESGVVAEFSTVSAAGLPIDTPTYYFPADDLSTIDLATGLPNPAKAERVRRNPKVGLLIEGRPEEPVVVIRARGAVRDGDIQANAIRYLAETGYQGISHGISWEEARKAPTYWIRIVVENTPERVYWWDSQAALDGPPEVWNAPADIVFPASDPAPPGRMRPSAWPVRPWPVVAEEAVAGGTPAHLSVLDPDGYPLPMRARSFDLTGEGFRLGLPQGAPWTPRGPASLTFAGFRTFVGHAEPDGDVVRFRVERALPQHPAALDTRQVLRPHADTVAKARARLEYEAERRGLSLPVIPDEPPPRTRIALLRQARLESDAPITGITQEHGNRTT